MKYDKISDSSHPQHKLRSVHTESPFKCDGCKEDGIGSHYRCDSCDYDLHKHCALASPSISHPFYTKCSFKFLPCPPGNVDRRCDACWRDVTGFVYHCRHCGFDLHPCCARLPMVLDAGEMELHLYRKVSAACRECERKGDGWSYRSTCKKYYWHVACVKEMPAEHGIYVGHGHGNSRKLVTRIPSLKGTLQTHHHKSKGKVKKYCKMACLAVQFIISAVLGDPTTLIAGFVGAWMSK